MIRVSFIEDDDTGIYSADFVGAVGVTEPRYAKKSSCTLALQIASYVGYEAIFGITVDINYVGDHIGLFVCDCELTSALTAMKGRIDYRKRTKISKPVRCPLLEATVLQQFDVTIGR